MKVYMYIYFDRGMEVSADKQIQWNLPKQTLWNRDKLYAMDKW